MKLAVFLLVITGIYGFSVVSLVKERRNSPQEVRQKLQTWPLIGSASLLYAAIAIQTIRFSVLGILPLL